MGKSAADLGVNKMQIAARITGSEGLLALLGDVFSFAGDLEVKA